MADAPPLILPAMRETHWAAVRTILTGEDPHGRPLGMQADPEARIHMAVHALDVLAGKR